MLAEAQEQAEQRKSADREREEGDIEHQAILRVVGNAGR